jgi:hypothetical protein
VSIVADVPTFADVPIVGDVSIDDVRIKPGPRSAARSSPAT